MCVLAAIAGPDREREGRSAIGVAVALLSFYQRCTADQQMAISVVLL